MTNTWYDEATKHVLQAMTNLLRCVDAMHWINE